MTVKFTNNASTTIGTGINASATSLTVASASSFPQLSGADDYCYLTLQGATNTTREVVKATALSSNTFTIVRAQDNTSAGTWAAGDIVELRMTAALLTDVIDAATVEGVKTNYQYTPTAGQTVFSGADNASATMIINQAALVSVYMNGVRLVQGTDYSVSSANNTVTLGVGATTADIIDIEVYGNFVGQSGAAVGITGGSITGTAITATTLGATGTATLNTLVSNNATISGGSLDGVTIGGTTRGAISGNAISGTSFASTGNMTFGDNDKAIFGASSDLQIYHDGSNSYIEDAGAGVLFIKGTGGIYLRGKDSDEDLGRFLENGAVDLYYDGSSKLATTSSGIDVTGTVTADGGDFSGLVQFNGAAGIQLDNAAQVHSWTLDDNFTSRLNIGTSSASAAWKIGSNNNAYLTVSPTGIDVTGTVTADGANIDGAVTTGDLTIDNDDTPTLNFKKAVSADILGTINVTTDAGSGGKMVFQTKRNGDTALDRMTINDDGNVGIGTSPDYPLHVSSTGVVLGLNATSGAVSQRFNENGTARFFLSTLNGSNGLAFVNGDGVSERMRIDSGGSVLIGKSTPTDLHNTWNHLIIGEKGAIISENGAGGIDGITLADNVYIDVDTGSYAYQTTAAASQITQSGGVIAFSNAASGSAGAALTPVERMRIDASGNFGIGVVPSAWWTGFEALQLGESAALTGRNGGVEQCNLTSNAVFDLTDVRYEYVMGASNEATLYQQTDGTHRFNTAPAGTAGNPIPFTESMRIDASGNVGIDATPSAWGSIFKSLDIRGSSVSSTTAGALVQSGNAYFNGTNWIYKNDGPATRVELNASTSGSVWYTSASGTAGNTITFTPSMTLDASGNLLVGVTSAQNFSGVTAAQNFVTPTNGNWAAGFRNTTASTPWGVAIDYTGANPNNYSSDFLYCSAGGLKFSVMSNGGVKNYQANDSNLSDRREKTNFSPAKSYLDAICAIPVQTFNYIDQNMEDDPSVTLGVVAQDVQTVAPEFVMESNWGTEEDPKMRLSIYQTDLQYALMKCIQEQQATIEALTARIAALES